MSGIASWEKMNYEHDGAYIEVDIETLIEKVIVSPTAEPWFEELVKSVADHYGLKKPIVPSSLSIKPKWGA